MGSVYVNDACVLSVTTPSVVWGEAQAADWRDRRRRGRERYQVILIYRTRGVRQARMAVDATANTTANTANMFL